MTTVVGIHQERFNMALLIADRQGTKVDREGSAHEKDLQRRKLWISEDGLVAFGHSGRYDEHTDALVKRMVEGDVDISKIIAEGKFPDLREHNYSQMRDEVPDLEALSSFLLISRHDGKPRLHSCFPLGSVQGRAVTWVGSGSSRVESYFKALDTISEARNYLPGGDMTRKDLIRVGLESVRHAQEKDIYSSGLDMVVMTPRATRDHYDDLTGDFVKRLKRVQAPYRDRKVKKK